MDVLESPEPGIRRGNEDCPSEMKIQNRGENIFRGVRGEGGGESTGILFSMKIKMNL